VHEPDPHGGRARVAYRVCFGAIVFVLFGLRSFASFRGTSSKAPQPL
jgi:hypothetical protein